MNQLQAKLTRDHEELDALLQRLAEDVEAPAGGALEATWSDFESRLVRHLQAEERFLLPLVEASNPEEVARTRAEHARIRDSIAELGVAIELHTARKSDIDELIRFLREHAKHEDEALYQLAGDKAPVAVQHRIFEDLKHAVRAVIRDVSPGSRARP
ncbi:MAG TPA: hemerythrin domain-containing protein [Polyangiaceae bacterium]